MPLARPISISSRGAKRRADQGGGGGGGSTKKYEDWIDLPLLPSDGWVVTTGSGAAACGATVAKVGNELHFKAPAAANMRIQGAEMKGLFMARAIHLKPWEQTGVTKPDGIADNALETEAFTLKIEVEFATSNGGPISGGTVGLAGYTTDQSGDPNATGYLWSAAQVLKNLGGDPSASTSVNMFRSGYKSYFTNSGVANGFGWKSQASPSAGSHNALVYATSPLRKEASTGRTNIQAGSYANDAPYFPMCTLNQQLFDNSTKFANQSIQKFWHLAIWFGTNSTAAGKGEIRISKIRYMLQPVQGRTDLP